MRRARTQPRKRLSPTWVLIVGTLTVLVAVVAIVVVLPFQTWRNQDDELAQRQRELETLTEVNTRLEAEIERLNTDAGVIEAARNELGFVQRGERRLSLVERTPLGDELPDQWPSSVVDAILDARAAHAAVAALEAARRSGVNGDSPAG